MKKIILLVVLIIASGYFSFAQNAIAKLKYEEAEEAFAKNNFQLTLTKLNETEALLKTSNPKILYLKILTQANIIKSDPYNDFTILDNTNKQIAKYLKEYDNLPNNEDKYRDIYKLSGELKQYPNTVQEFNLQKKQFLADEETRKSNENLKKEKADEAFKNFVFYSDFKIGLSLEETFKMYPAFRKNYKYKDKEPDYTIIRPKSNTIDYQPTGLFIKNNIVFGYEISFYFPFKVDDAEYTASTKTVTEVLSRLNNEFLFNPKETITTTSNSTGDPMLVKSYVWAKNNKTISLTFIKQGVRGTYLAWVTFESKDENLIK